MSVRFSPMSLRGVTLWVTADEVGTTFEEHYLPNGVRPPSGAINLGTDGVLTLWRYEVPELRPLSFELETHVTRIPTKRDQRFYYGGIYRTGIKTDLSQRDQGKRTYNLKASEQLFGMPKEWEMSCGLIVPHRSITPVQEAQVAGVADKTVTATLPGSITSGNTLVGYINYAIGNPGGSPTVSFALSNSAGSYTQAQENLCGAFFGHNGWFGYRLAGGSEGLAQDAVVTASNTDNTNCYVAEYTGIVDTSPLLDSAKTQDSFGGATSQASGTTGTLGTDEKLILFGYSIGSAGTSYSYGNDDGVPPTEVAAIDGTFMDTRIAEKIRSTATAASCLLSWTGSAESTGQVIVLSGVSVTPPTMTVPSNGLQFTSADYTTISGLSVAEGDEGVTSIIFTTSGAGEGVFRANAVSGITVDGTATNTLTCTGSLAEAQWNTFLAGVQYKGAVDLHGTDTITVTASDGTLEDEESFTVINDPKKLLVTFSGTYAQGVAAVEALHATLISGTSGTITMTADDGSATDIDDIELNLASPAPSPGGIGAGGGGGGSADMLDAYVQVG